jgi:hypothetical protein
MNAKLRNRCDHARRVGFRIAAARLRVQAEVMTFRAPLAVPTPGLDIESAGDREIPMRAISMWSDHGAPPQGRWWKTRSRRRPRSSTGLKILLAAGGVVAGVIGVSGVYPQVIDAGWTQGAGTYASRVPAPDAKTTTLDAKLTTRSDIPAPVQAPPRSTAMMTGEVPVATPSAVVPTPRHAAPASKPLPQAEPLAIAEIPDAAANADAPSTPAPTVAAKPVAPVVKRRIVSRAERPRRGGFTIGPFAFGASPFRM